MRRRSFLTRAAAVTSVAGSVLSATSRGQGRGANDEVRVAVIGCGSRGPQVALKDLPKANNAKVVAVCDVDPSHARDLASKCGNVPMETDYRKVLERKDVDAVIIATPNHTHVLIAAAACVAGKDVYVEKPLSHNIREGRYLTEIARKTGRIVQVGLQNSSDKGLMPAKEFYQSGALGAPKAVHVFWYRTRNPIGKVRKPTPVPKEIDYDLFQGPRPLGPLMRENLHYDWHWLWQTGNGEVGNTLVHNIDHTRILLGLQGHATAVRSVGGRIGWDDDGETPNTFLAAVKFPGWDVPFTCESRNLPFSNERKEMDSRFMRRTVGTIVFCENGWLYFDRGGGAAFGKDDKEIKRFPGDAGATHMANFIDAVRSRDEKSLRRGVEEGHFSSCVAHMANISHLTGEHGHTIESVEKEAPQEILSATEAWKSFKEHIGAVNVDLTRTPLTLGASLQFDPTSESFLETSEQGRMANYLIDEVYRPPFTMPKV
ncbi:MAG: Gfo/Idh/MocA family protein [Verrucomicrobiales bacterium]